jgi:hypothetical protein
LKDLVRYGADTLIKSDFHKDIIDAAVDTAALSIGQLVPSLLPAVLGVRDLAKSATEQKSDEFLKAIKDWAISGYGR